MEVQGTVFPGKEAKFLAIKSKYDRKTTRAQKSDAKEQPFVHRRTFGTTKNPNIAEKTVAEKLKHKKHSLKPVQTPVPPKKHVHKTTTNPKPVKEPPIEQTIPPSKEPADITNHEPESVTSEPTTKPSQATLKPVQTTPPPKEPVDKTTPNLKPVQLVQTTRSPNISVDTTSPNPKPARIEPKTEPVPEKAEPVQTIPSPKQADDKTSPDEHSHKTAQPVQTTPAAITVEDPNAMTTEPATESSPKTAVPVPTAKNLGSNTKPKKNKKSVSFSDGTGLQTPGNEKAKPRVSGTPYYTAKRCSKCRFNSLETSAYWLALIKVAENVGKHFLSAGLFKLALEAKAEPIWSLVTELEQYMSRHEYLSGDPEWRDVTAIYGLKTTTSNDQDEVNICDENGIDSTKQAADLED